MGEVYHVKYKKWGIGSIALFLSLFSTSFSFTYFSDFSDKSVGESILSYMQVKIPTSIISIVLYFIAMFIGNKFKEDYGAKAGRIISIIFLTFIAFQVVMAMIF